MNDLVQRRYYRLTRVQTFGREGDADFVAGSKSKTRFASVDNRLRDVANAKIGQTPSCGSVRKKTSGDALMLDFKDIARMAHSIVLAESGFALPCRIPDNPSESAITTHANALLLILEDQPADSAATNTAKAALRAKFVAYELPADFVEDLRADREAIREANKHNQGETQDGVEDTARIGQILALAADDVQELDAIMHNKYTRDAAKLAAWRSASRVERAPVRDKKPAANNSGTTTPTPVR